MIGISDSQFGLLVGNESWLEDFVFNWRFLGLRFFGSGLIAGIICWELQCCPIVKKPGLIQ